jgi:hypothetical protein
LSAPTYFELFLFSYQRHDQVRAGPSRPTFDGGARGDLPGIAGVQLGRRTGRISPVVG